MVNTSELRRGNWIAYKGNPFKVVEIYENRISANFSDQSFSERAFDPISLSPEWLEKLGFVKTSRYAVGAGSYHTYDLGKMYLLAQSDKWVFHDFSVQYVHQLMNLYHALTGTELVIDQTKNQ